MAQRAFWNWKDDDLTIDMSQWLNGLFPKGVYRGFDFVNANQAGMTLKLTHEVTGFKFTKQDLSESDFCGVLKTPQGSLIREDEEILINIAAADPTNPRIDAIYCNHTYIETQGGAAALYSVVTGTPGAVPVAPVLINDLTDLLIGYLYVPAATTDLSDLAVVMSKVEVPTLAEENYAHRDKVNRYTKQAQEAPENAAITFDVGTGELTINSESNMFALPVTITTADVLNKITEKPAGTYLKLRVMTVLGIKVTHSTVPAVGEIFNEVNEETLIYPKGTVLDLVAQSDGSWRLIDYSIGAVWNRNNSFKAAQQLPEGSGIKIKSVSYVVSLVTYTAWILELDASNPNLVLDMDNATQMGGFNPATDVLELKFIDVIGYVGNVGGVNKGNGWTPMIRVKGTLGQTINARTAPEPAPITGDYIIFDNGTDMYSVGYSASFPQLKLAEGVNATNSSYFQIIINGSYKFTLVPVSTLIRGFGGLFYNNNTFFADGTSHRIAIDSLVSALTAPGTLLSFVLQPDFTSDPAHPLRYSKSANGTVRFTGRLLVGPVLEAIVFATLPVGYRPTKTVAFKAVGLGVGIVNNPVCLIHPNGDCEITDQEGNDLDSGDHAWLNCVEYNIND